MAWRSRNPLRRAAHDLAKLDGLVADQLVGQDRTLAFIVGISQDKPVWSTTLARLHSSEPR